MRPGGASFPPLMMGRFPLPFDPQGNRMTYALVISSIPVVLLIVGYFLGRILNRRETHP